MVFFLLKFAVVQDDSLPQALPFCSRSITAELQPIYSIGMCEQTAQ